MKKKHHLLIIDISYVTFYCLNATWKKKDTSIVVPEDWQEDQFKQMWYSKVLQGIHKFKPDEVIIAEDNRDKYWRRDIFPDYKTTRKLKRAKSHIDFDHAYGIISPFIEEFKEAFPVFKWMNVHGAEADDIVGALTSKLHKFVNITAIANDGDWKQCYQYPGYRQFQLDKAKELKIENPKRILLEKFILGDKKDDIPQLKAGVGVKTANDILNGDWFQWLKDESLISKFDLNRKLIDFKFTPEEIRLQIIKEYLVPHGENRISFKGYNQFFRKHQMKNVQQETELLFDHLNNLRGLKG